MKSNEKVGLGIIIGVVGLIGFVIFGIANYRGYNNGYEDGEEGNRHFYNEPSPYGYNYYNENSGYNEFGDYQNYLNTTDKIHEGGKDDGKGKYGIGYETDWDQSYETRGTQPTRLQSVRRKQEEFRENIQGVGRLLQVGVLRHLGSD